jgi:hypothetical protein
MSLLTRPSTAEVRLDVLDPAAALEYSEADLAAVLLEADLMAAVGHGCLGGVRKRLRLEAAVHVQIGAERVGLAAGA